MIVAEPADWPSDADCKGALSPIPHAIRWIAVLILSSVCHVLMGMSGPSSGYTY